MLTQEFTQPPQARSVAPSKKTVLLPLFPENDFDTVFQAVKSALAGEEYHLIGAFAKPAFMVDGPAALYPHYPLYPNAEAFKQWKDYYEAAEAKARSVFERFNFDATTHRSWVSDFGKGITAFINESLYADLIIVTPQTPVDGNDAMSLDARFMAGFLTRSRTPILALPTGAPDRPVFTRPVIAWKENAEAASAVKTLTTLVTARSEINLLSVVAGDIDTSPDSSKASLAARYLARKGYHVEKTVVGTHGKPVAERILEAAEDLDASLIVIGAFNHPRWMGLVSGTVTTPLIKEAKRPFLLVR